MKRLMLLAIAALMALLGSSAQATIWHDDFDDGVVDLTNYTRFIVAGGGNVNLDESSLECLTAEMNSPGGSYVLTAVQVQPGDTVRTKFKQASAWDYWGSRSAIGLAYTTAVTDALLYNGICMYMHQRFDDVRAYRSEYDSLGESQIIMNTGDPEQQTWIYEMALGAEVGGNIDIVFSVYDELGTQLGNSVTLTANSPTGEMYWYIGNTKTLDFVYELDIVPEPAAIALLATGGLLLRRKRQ